MSYRSALLFISLFCLSLSSASAEIVRSIPLGVNKVTCPVNSDTIVGVPFRQEGSLGTVTAGTPLDVGGQPDLKEIPLDSMTLSPSSLGQHYLKFNDGTHDGRWYNITDNSATSSLSGSSPTGC